MCSATLDFDGHLAELCLDVAALASINFDSRSANPLRPGQVVGPRVRDLVQHLIPNIDRPGGDLLPAHALVETTRALDWLAKHGAAQLDECPELGGKRIERYGATLLRLCGGA